MNHRPRSRTFRAGAALAVAVTLGTLVNIHDAADANADVCASAGRRVSVSGFANLADVMAPYVPPPAYYAPVPEDYYVPPPPVTGCIGVNGRRISVAGCN